MARINVSKVKKLMKLNGVSKELALSCLNEMLIQSLNEVNRYPRQIWFCLTISYGLSRSIEVNKDQNPIEFNKEEYNRIDDEEKQDLKTTSSLENLGSATCIGLFYNKPVIEKLIKIVSKLT